MNAIATVSAFAVFVQVISAQCLNPGLGLAENAALANMPYNTPFGNMPFNPMANAAYNQPANAPYNQMPYPISGVNGGGGFMVTSSSPIAPSGVTVQSENLLVEGPLAVSGQIPFLGVVSMEGPLPAAGQGAVAYGCGNGNVGMVSEGLEAAAYPGGIGVGAGLTGLGIGPLGQMPMRGPGCGAML